MMTAVKAKTVSKRLIFEPNAKFQIETDSSLPVRSASLDPAPAAQPRPQASHDANRAVAKITPGWKLALDQTSIFLSLPITLPLMLLIVIWIRLVSNGPALFRQERIGKDGKRFVLYKFRSMKMNVSTGRHETYLRHLVKSDSPMIKLDLLCDSRLIPGGCLLRASGLDELPQLLNVLRGEMSLVGPRPCLPQEFIFFSESQRERFVILPGLTGSWQVNGKNRSTFSEMNEMDICYARKASPKLDLSIMLRTPTALITQTWQAFQQRGTADRASKLKQSTDKSASGCRTQRL